MGHVIERQGLFVPAEMVDTGFGFAAHPLQLCLEQRRLHRFVIGQTLADRRIQRVLQRFDRYQDTGTRNHSLAVGWLATAIAIELGMDAREAGYVARAGIGHDVAKEHELIHEAVVSTKKFDEDPRLLRKIQRHPVWGSFVIRDLGFGPNESMLVASHHGFQTDPDRPAYGITADRVCSFPEPIRLGELSVYEPPTKALAEVLAAADVCHALSAPPMEFGRFYNPEVSPERALGAVYTLNVPAAVMKATGQVTGYGSPALSQAA